MPHETPQDVIAREIQGTGAGEGTRTHTPVKGADFKSAASAIPPPRPSSRAPGVGRWARKVVNPILRLPEVAIARIIVDGGDGRIRTAE